MSEKQLLMNIEARGKFSVSDNTQLVEYKELADKGLIKVEEIKDTGVYVVSKNDKDQNS